MSKLKFNDNEMDLISKDLSKMLDFINQLENLDTDGVEPLIHINEETNNWREDQIDGMLLRKLHFLIAQSKMEPILNFLKF